jgi:formiminotetrahydrofolate cyclodeaminase
MLNMPLGEFIEAVASREPTPGGGSVAGAAGALAVALGRMSLAFTTGKKKFAAHEDFYAHLAGRLERASGMFARLIAEDIEAYGLYNQAIRDKNPTDSEPVQLALAAAVGVPIEMSKLALALLEDLHSLSDKCSKWLVSDLAAAAALAVATVRMSGYNVRINTGQMTDQAAAAELLEVCRQDVAHAEHLLARIERAAVE